jgi:hypothetical protein
MNENKKNAWLYVALTLVTSAVAVIFQYILSKDYVEESSGLYIRGTSTPLAFYIFLAVAVVLFFTSVFMFRKELLPDDLKTVTWYRGVMAVGAASAALFSVYAWAKQKGGLGLLDGNNTGTVYKLQSVCAILALFAGVYYLSIVFFGQKKSNSIAFLSFFAVLWTLVYLLGICFDQTSLLNSPIKLLRQFALISLMLFQLLESRAMIGKHKPKLYFVFSNLAVLFVSAAFVPELIIWLQGDMALTLDVANAIYCLVAALYALSGAIAFATSDCGQVTQKATETKAKPKDDLFSPDDDSE